MEQSTVAEALDEEKPVYNETTFLATDADVDEVMFDVIETADNNDGGGGYQMMKITTNRAVASTAATTTSTTTTATVKYAAIVNNVSFAYGSGKKTVKALNDTTLKVPVGNM